jgi:hypothetical protein
MHRWTVCVSGSVVMLAVAGSPCLAYLAADEDKVKEACVAFQDAIKARDGAKLWDLLDSASRASAEKFARSYKARYAKADDAGKKELQKNLGLTAEQLADLTPQLFLQSKRYHGKYHEVPGSKLDKIAIDADQATVFYIEDDGDREKLTFLRQEGKWKVSAPPP